MVTVEGDWLKYAVGFILLILVAVVIQIYMLSEPTGKNMKLAETLLPDGAGEVVMFGDDMSEDF